MQYQKPRTINADISRENLGSTVEAIQGDGNIRQVLVQLQDNGVNWFPPMGAWAEVKYVKPDGTIGLYDKLADNTPAVSIRGSVATVFLAAQMLTVPGKVEVSITFTNAQLDQVTTFPFFVSVKKNIYAGAQKSEDYIKLQWLEDKLDERMELAKQSGIFDGPQGKAFTYEDFTPEQLAALTGPQGPMGHTGPAGSQGPQGVAGTDGKTPIKGVDYGTPEEITAITTQVAEQVQMQMDNLRTDMSANAASDAETKRSLNALWKLNQGISYQFETDDTAAYRKIVPSGAKLASMQKIGGHTVVWNQLVSSDTAIIIPVSNHKIVRRIDGVWTLIASDGTEFSVTGGTDMVFDLSAMFGAGNEPSTVAEFRSMFPEDYYPYNPGELLSFPVHAVVKRGKNLWGGDAIRASLEALGIDATGNNVNIPGSKISNKVVLAVQPKAGVQYTFLLTSRLSGGTGTTAVVSNFCFQYDDGTKEPIKMVRNDSMSMVKTSSNPAKTLTGIVGEYQITTKFYIDPDRTGLFEGNINAESYSPYREPVTYPIPEAVMALEGYCVGSNYIDFEHKQFVKQCEIVDGEVVDLAAPVVTNISDLIGNTFQEPLTVEAGGSLTFQNANGDGYQIPVPNSVEYLISLAEVNG